jgi:D-tyrosyl-tRNA(Tyr) deacylase
MKALLQKVSRASVSVEGRIVSETGRGLLVLLGVGKDDTPSDVPALADKIVNLRIFENDGGKFDFSVKDTGGEILLVSQFTLYGDCSRGRRPDFTSAAAVDTAREIYDKMLKELNDRGVRTLGGVFRAMMQVSLINEGPVTIMLESGK